MKVKVFMTAALCLLVMNAKAQKNIEAMIKKCETHSSVNMQVIKQKNRKTVNISINADKKLVAEFVNAFKKDEPDADEHFSVKNKGKEKSIRQRFSQAHYSILLNGNDNARIMANYNPVNRLNLSDADMENLKMSLKSLGNLDSMKFHLDNQQEHWKPFMEKNRHRIDSLIKFSSESVKSINWDSVASVFVKEMDAAIRKIDKQEKKEE